ncbi:MAG: hypothetical protein Q8O95_00380 [bacterium]|nr:hypothetical protein [bacterium]
MRRVKEDEYVWAKKIAYDFFQENPIIRSAVFGNITLNADGFTHLIAKDLRHKRNQKNQMKRFELLKYLKPVLEGMKYYQEYLERKQAVKVKRNKTIFLEFRVVKYWAFVAVIKDRIRIKVILKKIGDGTIIFWSIVPSWKLRGYKEFRKVVLSNGNLEED